MDSASATVSSVVAASSAELAQDANNIPDTISNATNAKNLLFIVSPYSFLNFYWFIPAES
jgi:hypothetical protein